MKRERSSNASQCVQAGFADLFANDNRTSFQKKKRGEPAFATKGGEVTVGGTRSPHPSESVLDLADKGREKTATARRFPPTKKTVRKEKDSAWMDETKGGASYDRSRKIARSEANLSHRDQYPVKESAKRTKARG